MLSATKIVKYIFVGEKKLRCKTSVLRLLFWKIFVGTEKKRPREIHKIDEPEITGEFVQFFMCTQKFSVFVRWETLEKFNCHKFLYEFSKNIISEKLENVSAQFFRALLFLEFLIQREIAGSGLVSDGHTRQRF